MTDIPREAVRAAIEVATITHLTKERLVEAMLTAALPHLTTTLLADAWQAGWAARAERPHLKRGESVPAPSHINPYRGGRNA